METEPLALLAGAVYPGAAELLTEAKQQGLRLGVVSDYPARQKLEALRLAHFFDVLVSAQDDDVQRLKPDPRGLVVALQRLGGGGRSSVRR